MKKIFILTLFTLLSVTSNAQFGVKGGYVNSTLNSGFDNEVKDGTPTITNRSSNHGFTFGVMYEQCLGCDFSFQPEISYTQKGQSYVTENRKTSVDLAYLDIPLNFKWKILKPLYIYAGPYISLGLSKSHEVVTGGTTFSEGLESSYKTFDWGVNGGLGLQFDKYFIDGRVSRGAVSQDKIYETDDLTVPAYGFRNFTIQFTGGLFF